MNSAVAFALTWTAIYNQLLCGYNFLLSFWLLLRYVETGERRFYIAQCITILLALCPTSYRQHGRNPRRFKLT